MLFRSTIADRALMLADGNVIFLGALDEIDRAADPRVGQFFRREPDEAGGVPPSNSPSPES